MKNVLILGASELQLPAITRSKLKGHKVATLDLNPHAVGRKYADQFFEISTTDELGVLEAARRFRADAILTIATDMPMRAVAYACHKLGLPALSTHAAYLATDKAAMIEAFHEAGVRAPRHVTVERDDTELPTPPAAYPLLVKPVDSSGSRGVALAEGPDDVWPAIKRARTFSKSARVLVEEFLVGREVSVELICAQGAVETVAVTDKQTTGAPHFVETGHSQPSQLLPSEQEEVIALARQAAIALGLDNCAAHAEIMYTANGPTMIEIGARLGGDFITSHLVPSSTGVDIVGAVIDVALGIKPDLQPSRSQGSAVRFFTETLALEEHEFFNTNTDARIIDFQYEQKSSETLSNTVSNSTDRLGHVIAYGDTAASALAACHPIPVH